MSTTQTQIAIGALVADRLKEIPQSELVWQLRVLETAARRLAGGLESPEYVLYQCAKTRRMLGLD